MHQVLQADEARAIPVWLSQPKTSASHLQCSQRAYHPHRRPLAGATWPMQWRSSAGVWPGWSSWNMRITSWCIRPTSEETECVTFDRPRVLRVLARIVAELDALARCLARAEALPDGQQERRARHRQRLAEPEPPPRRLRRWEERAASHGAGTPAV